MKNILLVFAFFLSVYGLYSQNETYHEEMNDPYLPPMEERGPRQPGYSFISDNVITIQVNTDAAGNNIPNDAANEPSLAIDPNDGSRMVIGWRQFDNINSDFRQAGNAVTTDGGLSWLNNPVIEAGVFRSDPVMGSDNNGNFFYNSLTGQPFSCQVFRSEDGEDWADKKDAFGGDKQWMVIDNTEGEGDGNIYSYWTGSSSCNFTRSIDNGENYDRCYGMPRLTWGSMAIGPEGELYTAGGGSSGITVNRSSFPGDASEVTWELSQVVPLNGSQSSFGGPNPVGLNGQIWIDVDKSGGIYNGRVYVGGTINPRDVNDPCDFMLASSSDGGMTWSEPVKINEDASGPNNWNWMGTMSVAPNGRIDAVWLDYLSDSSGFLSSLYYSFSVNGGETWSKNEKISEEFDPHVGYPQQPKMGDYYHMISHDDGAHLAWAGTFNGEQDVYYSFIPFARETATHDPKSFLNNSGEIVISPNPSDGRFELSIMSTRSHFVILTLMDLAGRELVKRKYDLQKGENILDLELTEDRLSGMFFLEVVHDNGDRHLDRILIAQ